MTPTYLLIDGNAIAHANHNATKLTVGTLQVQAVFGFLKSLRAMLEADPGAKPIVLWDGRAEWRLAIYPEYKGNRKPADAKQAAHKAAFKAQMPLLEYALDALGVLQLRSPLLEADDLVGHMVRTKLPGTYIKLITGDGDWLQLVQQDVEWVDPIRDRRVTTDNFFDHTGYLTSAAFVQGKALQGDSSDNIKGVGGIGEKGAAELLAFYGLVDELFRRVEAGEKLRLNKAQTHLCSPEGRAVFERNCRLTDLRRSRAPEPGEVIKRPGSRDPAKFEALCRRLMFASILRELPQFLRSFGITPAVAAA